MSIYIQYYGAAARRRRAKDWLVPNKQLREQIEKMHPNSCREERGLLVFRGTDSQAQDLSRAVGKNLTAL